MSDLLTTNPPQSATTVAPPAGAPLPPPPPPSLDEDQAGRRRTLAIIGGLALLAAVIMGLLWTSARSDRDDAIAERDAAQAATVAGSDQSEQALTDLDAATATNERLAAETEAAEAATTEAIASAEAANAATAELEVRNAELTAELATLQSSLTDAETAAAEAAAAEAAAAEAAPEASEANSFDIAVAVDFARFIGEQLASIEGDTVLGQGQHTCLGTAVVNDIGLDAIGAGLENGASSSASSVVVDAIERGAISCGIDPSAIF
jgi:hypothetical protein